jgi:hypothetical protein
MHAECELQPSISNSLTHSLAATDDVTTMVYAIVMLNTDAHNAQVLKKMSSRAFADNFTHVSVAYLKVLYQLHLLTDSVNTRWLTHVRRV